MASPSVVVLGGPNGGGKSTIASSLLRGQLRVSEFVNADVIAQGLSAFEPDGMAFQAGRLMLERLHELARRRVSFAFETTLASRLSVARIERLMKEGYLFHLVFLWLASPDLAVARVSERVRSGGQGVSEETIRRRYNRGLTNFFRLYRPMTTTWRMYDNSHATGARLVASGMGRPVTRVLLPETWREIEKGYS